MPPESQKRLAGRVAVVTGAGRGLGRSVAAAFAAAGARVALVDLPGDELADAEATLRAAGHDVLAVGADVTDPGAVAALAASVRAAFGPARILVNAAAILEERPFLDCDLDSWGRTLAVNLTGPWLCCRAFVPEMVGSGRGSIINVTSRAGIEPFAGETAYCASKFGLEGFSRSLAIELGPHGVAVNLVTPGVSIKPTSLTLADFAALSPAQRARYVDSATLTPAFLHLAIADERGINGQRFSAHELAQRLGAGEAD